MRPLTNLARSVETPNQLVSRGHNAQLPRMLPNGEDDWALFKADGDVDYKQLLIDLSDQRNAIVALRYPTAAKWHCYCDSLPYFRARYSGPALRRSVANSRGPGQPLPWHSDGRIFFEDFASLIRKILGGKALEAPALFFPLLGFRLKPGMAVYGPPVTFLGLLGEFPSFANGYRMSVSLPEARRNRRPHLVGWYLKGGKIHRICLGCLVGKCSFAQTSIFGKFARDNSDRSTRSLTSGYITPAFPHMGDQFSPGGVGR